MQMMLQGLTDSSPCFVGRPINLDMQTSSRGAVSVPVAGWHGNAFIDVTNNQAQRLPLSSYSQQYVVLYVIASGDK